MALTYIGTSAWVIGTAAVTPTNPAGLAAGHLVVITLVSKYDDAALGGAPAGWLEPPDHTAINTGSPTGNDSGNMRGRMFYRVWQAGDTMPSLAPTPNNVSAVRAEAWSCGAGESFALEGGIYAANQTANPRSVSTTLSIAAGDQLLTHIVSNGDVIAFGTNSLTLPGGVSGGSLATHQADLASATGTDQELRAGRYHTFTGSGTGTVTLANSPTSSTANTRLIMTLLRVRASTDAAKTLTDTATATDSMTVARTSTMADTATAVDSMAADDGSTPTYSLVQSNQAVDSVADTTQSITLAQTATTTGVLVVNVSVDKNAVSMSMPAGWTKVNEAINASTSSAQFWKPSAGETAGTTFTVTHTGAALAAKIEIEEWDSTNGGAWSQIGQGVTNSDGTTTVTAQSATSSTLSAPHGIAIALASKDTQQANENVNWSAGWTERWDPSGDTLPGLWTATRVTSGTGAVSATATLVGSGVLADQMNASILVLSQAPGGGGPITPTLNRRIVGVAGEIAVSTNNADSVRLKIGTNTAVTTGVQFTSPVTPDAQGNSHHDWTGLGLTAGATYYYRVAMEDTGATEHLDTAATVGQFKVAPTGQTNFSFSFASCEVGADPVIWDTIAARSDDLFFHVGDLYYADGSGTDLANYRSKMGAKLSATKHQSVLSQRGFVYTPSDHDGSMQDSGTGQTLPTAYANFNQVHREYIPAPHPANGVYFTFTWGRVRFAVLDNRSFASDSGATDNSSKTLLGATQKQWLKDLITNLTEPVLVLISSQPWTGAANGTGDDWRGYDTERQEMGTFFANSGKNILMLHGDQHAVAADDGTNSAGGIVVFAAAPLDNTASQRGTYTHGPYPASGTASVSQYGSVDITDTGSQIALAFNGKSSDNTVRVSLTKTFTLDTPKTLTDTASAADTLTVTRTSTMADTATATDNMTVQQGALKSLTDTATSVDTTTVTRTSTMADTATAVDSLSVAQGASVSLTDSASGADSLSAARTSTMGDTAAAVDALSVQQGALKALTDTATSADTASVARSSSVADQAAAVDTMTVAITDFKALSDTATATDSLSVAITETKTLSDTASAADSVAVSRSSTLSDSASVTESLSVVGGARPTDTATAADSLTAARSSTFGDSATAQDSLSATGGASLSDTATSTDALSAARTSTMADSATATDALAISRTITPSDSATSTDNLTITATRPMSEAANAVDSLVVQAPGTANLSDTATSTQSLSAARSSTFGDTATASDALTISQTKALSDSATSTQSLTTAKSSTMGDTAAATDSLAVTSQTKALTDSAAASDSLAVAAGSNKTLSDTATASDSLSVTVILDLTDTASATDAITTSATVFASDTATAADLLSMATTVALSDLAEAEDRLRITGPEIPPPANFEAWLVRGWRAELVPRERMVAHLERRPWDAELE